MVDTNLLRDLINIRGETVESVSEVIHVDKSTLYRKLKSGNFTVKEADMISNHLKMNRLEKKRVFF